MKNPSKYPFEKYITKKGAEKVTNKMNKFMSLGTEKKKVSLSADIYLPSFLLPSSPKVFEILKRYPVKINTNIGKITN